MDPEEEKAQEIELLQSMYPDEMAIISPAVYTITITLEPPTSRNGLITKNSNQSLIIHVEYSEGYPETLPIIDLSFEYKKLDDDDEESDDDSKRIEEKPLLLNNTDLDTLREKAAQEVRLRIFSTLE